MRVATNQARALAELGHEVLLAAAARGYDGALPRQVEGVPAALFPARQLLPGTGFAGLTAPGLVRALPGLARAADVLHIPTGGWLQLQTLHHFQTAALRWAPNLVLLTWTVLRHE